MPSQNMVNVAPGGYTALMLSSREFKYSNDFRSAISGKVPNTFCSVLADLNGHPTSNMLMGFDAAVKDASCFLNWSIPVISVGAVDCCGDVSTLAVSISYSNLYCSIT